MAHRGRRLTDEERADIVRRYLTGEPVHLIARRFDVSTQTVKNCAKAASAVFEGKRVWSRAKKQDEPRQIVLAPPPIAHFYTPSLAEVARLKAKGLKNTAIAALLRLPYRVVESVPAATPA